LKSEQIIETDRRWMAIALEQARLGVGKTHPNPAVGAVLVRSGRLIAMGTHTRAGGPHAEIDAIEKAGDRARSATLYVTLEPCAHTGRTGPCADAVIAAGIKRVVVGCLDSNPAVNGRGVRRMRKAGIKVEVGCLQDACFALNRGFLTWIARGRPFVTLKSAATLDGVIGTDTGNNRPTGIAWITGKIAQRRAHHLRAQHDGILVGVQTVLRDDPRLTIRQGVKRHRAGPGFVRVVLDSHLRTPTTARLFTTGVRSPVLVVGRLEKKGSAAERLQSKRQRALEAVGAQILLVPRASDGRPALPKVLTALAVRGIQSLLVEGGATVAGRFVSEGCVDRVAFFMAPRLAGTGVRMINGNGPGLLRALPLIHLQYERLGDDLLIEADVAALRPGK
jgi:diaminohydroxyphosphoribosylaminopyrimidine deaminase / 5-amino-6-(5-phosphoribosylamino)uracil reductase